MSFPTTPSESRSPDSPPLSNSKTIVWLRKGLMDKTVALEDKIREIRQYNVVIKNLRKQIRALQRENNRANNRNKSMADTVEELKQKIAKAELEYVEDTKRLREVIENLEMVMSAESAEKDATIIAQQQEIDILRAAHQEEPEADGESLGSEDSADASNEDEAEEPDDIDNGFVVQDMQNEEDADYDVANDGESEEELTQFDEIDF